MRTIWNKGKTLSPEHKAKIAEKMKGRQPWNKGKKGLMPVAWNKGKKMTDATKGKIASKLKGRVPWNKGRNWSPEMKAKFKTIYHDRHNS